MTRKDGTARLYRVTIAIDSIRLPVDEMPDLAEGDIVDLKEDEYGALMKREGWEEVDKTYSTCGEVGSSLESLKIEAGHVLTGLSDMVAMVITKAVTDE